MSTAEPILALPTRPAPRRSLLNLSVVADYFALTKPDVTFLILITAFAGFYLGCAAQPRTIPMLLLINTLLGTLMVAGGAATLNQYIERKYDAQMRRTSRRPLAAARLSPSAVLAFGVSLAVKGAVYLVLTTNWLATGLAVFTLLSYLFCYTPLKRRTPLCTLVGAIPGAMPPLIGWAAAFGSLTLQAWILFAIVFLWQFPHFMAIAWMYRDDYACAGYLTLPHDHNRGWVASLQTLLPLVALLLLTAFRLAPGRVSLVYTLGATLLGLGFFIFGVRFVVSRSAPSARKLLQASIFYLPLLFGLILLTHN